MWVHISKVVGICTGTDGVHSPRLAARHLSLYSREVLAAASYGLVKLDDCAAVKYNWSTETQDAC